MIILLKALQSCITWDFSTKQKIKCPIASWSCAPTPLLQRLVLAPAISTF